MVLPHLRMGGAERLVYETFRLAYEVGHPEQYALIALSADGAEEAPALADFGVEVRTVGGRSRLDPRVVPALRRTLRSLAPDVVHSHLPRVGVLVRLALAGTGTPHLYTEHNLPEAYLPVTRLANRWSLWANDVTAAVSADVARSVGHRGARAAGRRLVVVPNGIDGDAVARAAARGAVRASLALPAGAEVIGLLAHFRPQKAHDVLLRTVARLNRPRLHLVLAGSDEGTEGAARALARQLGIAERTHFLGFRRDAAAVLAALDVLVMPSRQEGLPVALLEAMALGRPVVATRVGGIPQVVTDGADGLLVPAGDEDALVAAVRRVLDDPQLATQLGARARHTVAERFGLPAMVAAYQALYAELAPGDR